MRHHVKTQWQERPSLVFCGFLWFSCLVFVAFCGFSLCFFLWPFNCFSVAFLFCLCGFLCVCVFFFLCGISVLLSFVLSVWFLWLSVFLCFFFVAVVCFLLLFFGFFVFPLWFYLVSLWLFWRPKMEISKSRRGIPRQKNANWASGA